MSNITMPRPRYIAMRIESQAPLSRRALSNAIFGRARHEGWKDADAPQLTRFGHPHAIVRVEHVHQQAARELLGRITWAIDGAARLEFRLVTLGASGTLKALTGRLGILAERAERPPRTAPNPAKPNAARARNSNSQPARSPGPTTRQA